MSDSTSPDPAASGATAATTTGPAGTAAAPRRRPRWLPIAVAGGVVALVAAGVLGYALTRTPEPGFGSPEAIAALLAERGAPCADFGDGGDGRAKERGACYADGEKIVIAVFPGRAQAEEHWERQLSLTADNETLGMVIGDTWTISGTNRAYLRHAATVLEAEYRTN